MRRKTISLLTGIMFTAFWIFPLSMFAQNITVKGLVTDAAGEALTGVALGKLSTYKRIADDVEKPKAVRAVGSAVGSNPVSCIIPCHRIVRTDGGLGGYHWGLDLKKEMLEREKQLVK